MTSDVVIPYKNFYFILTICFRAVTENWNKSVVLHFHRLVAVQNKQGGVQPETVQIQVHQTCL